MRLVRAEQREEDLVVLAAEPCSASSWPPTATVRASDAELQPLAGHGGVDLDRAAQQHLGGLDRLLRPARRTTPGLMMPAFSPAISLTSSPRKSRVVERDRGDHGDLARRRRWWRPRCRPCPTSTTATSTGASAKAANAIAVITSKKDSRTLAARRVDQVEVRRDVVVRRDEPLRVDRLAVEGDPLADECRCGLVNRPVRRPNARSSASIIRAVEVLPLVPVTWITGEARCGIAEQVDQRADPVQRRARSRAPGPLADQLELDARQPARRRSVSVTPGV